MARACRYGGVQPDVYENMDWELGFEVSRRLTIMYQEETKQRYDFDLEIAKATIKTIAESGI